MILKEYCDVPEDTSWDTNLTELGMDSLDIIDFLYSLEKEFKTKLSNGSLVTVKRLTLNAVRLQLLTNLVQPASAE